MADKETRPPIEVEARVATDAIGADASLVDAEMVDATGGAVDAIGASAPPIAETLAEASDVMGVVADAI
eukprot:11418185-Prorocentrum_lima.AAC.1